MRFSYESLLNADVDAAEIFGLQGALARHNPGVRLLYDTALEWHVLTGTWPMHHVLATYRDVVQRHPTLPKQLLEGFHASREYAKKHLRALLDAFVEHFGGRRQDLEGHFAPNDIGASYSWSMSHDERKTIRIVSDMCLEYGFIRKGYDLDELIWQP